MQTFNDLNLIERILKAIKLAGYTEPTPIQVQAIPLLLEKKDLLGSAQTGTGKTAAFAIPILQNIFNNKIHGAKTNIEALIITPTRELAAQISENFTTYAKYLNIRNTTVYGGVSQKRQVDAIKKGVEVLIATPGRLLDLINQGFIDLTHVKYFVLDEADQMLDMGFIKDVEKIMTYINKDRQSMLFSATMPKPIEKLANEILKNPTRISVVPVTKTLDLISQRAYHVNKKEKTSLLVHLIKEENMKSVLVFSRTKYNANRIADDLVAQNITAEVIHGNKSQAYRDKALLNFKTGKIRILVASDIAARGLDIDKLEYVINYDLPEVPETYIHRIGRTGRAGKSGVAISFYDAMEYKLLVDIEKHINSKLPVLSHPFMIKKAVVENTKKVTTISKKEEVKPSSTKKDSKKDNKKPEVKYDFPYQYKKKKPKEKTPYDRFMMSKNNVKNKLKKR